MRAATNEINALQVLEPISRSEMQHLAQIVREVERRPAIDLMLPLPIGRSEHSLEANPSLDVVDAHLTKLPDDQVAKPSPLTRPVHVRMLMRYGHQNIKRTHAPRRQGGIGYTSVLNVE